MVVGHPACFTISSACLTKQPLLLAPRQRMGGSSHGIMGGSIWPFDLKDTFYPKGRFELKHLIQVTQILINFWTEFSRVNFTKLTITSSFFF